MYKSITITITITITSKIGAKIPLSSASSQDPQVSEWLSTRAGTAAPADKQHQQLTNFSMKDHEDNCDDDGDDDEDDDDEDDDDEDDGNDYNADP